MAGINHVRRWVMSQMTKKADDGIMITLPDSSKVDLNVNITMDRLLRNGIDPNAFTNPEQVNNAVNMVNSRMVERAIPANSAEGREITEKLFGKQKAPVFDLEGNRIPEGSGIMGGKAVKELMDSGQVSKGARGMKKSKKVEDREMFQKSNLNKTEAQLKAEMEASNKKGIANIKNKRQLTEDEIAELDMDIGGLEYTNDFDGTVGSANKLRKERADYIREMELEYKKGNLDPEPGSGTSQRKRFLQKKLEEAESSGDARLISREEREELFDLDDIPEYATGGRAGFKGGYLASGAKKLGKKYKGSTLSAILENPKLLGAELGHDGIMEVMRLLPSLFAKGGRAGYKSGLSVEEMLNEERRKKGVEEDPLTSTNTIPNLLDPKVMSNIAIETGLPTTTQKFDTGGYFQEKLDYPSASDASTIKSIQDFKRGPDRFTAPEISDFMGVDGIFNGLNSEQVQSIYDKVETDDSDPYADIKGQTAGLGVASFLAEKFGPKIGGAIFNYGKNKILNKGKNVFIDKPIKKILTTSGGSKKIKTGGGGGSSQANVGGGNTAKNSKGQTASQATKAGTGTSQGYSQHYADGGITRANFVGGGMGRRGFLKMLAGAGAGIAGLKSGLVNILGKGGTKEVAKEVVKQSAGTPPPYFFKLVDKIKTLGDDVTEKAATKDREVVKRYKDFELTEDVATGEQTIQRIKQSDFEYYDEQLAEDVYMNYKPGKGQADETTGKVMDEYVEDTSYIRTSGSQKGDIYDTVDGIPDDVLEEAGEKIIEKKIKSSPLNKASGGLARFGYQTGGDVSYDATDPIYGSSAATFTPNTVMDQFGNQVQSELGNNFNKPLIPQVTDQAATNRRYTPPTEKESLTAGPVFPAGTGGLTDIPAAGGMGGLGETDMPIAGGINNQIGKPTTPPGSGNVVGNYNDPLPQDQLMAGFAEWKRNNPDKVSMTGHAAMSYMTLPNGEPIDFSGGAQASNMAQYLESIGQPPMTRRENSSPIKRIGNPNAELKMALASGGIARMLGE